jgi:hypothetical protein
VLLLYRLLLLLLRSIGDAAVVGRSGLIVRPLLYRGVLGHGAVVSAPLAMASHAYQ